MQTGNFKKNTTYPATKKHHKLLSFRETSYCLIFLNVKCQVPSAPIIPISAPRPHGGDKAQRWLINDKTLDVIFSFNWDGTGVAYICTG